MECLHVTAEKIVVAPNAAVPREASPVRPAGLPDGPFLLMVNPGRKNKNWEMVLRGFELFLRGEAGVRLVMAGHLGDQEAGVQQLIAELSLGASVVTLGYVSDDELLFLYQNALAMAFISTYEGFGIPALESMN